MRRDVGPARAERWRRELLSVPDVEPGADAFRALPASRVAGKLVRELGKFIVDGLDVDQDGRGWNRGPTGPRPMHPIGAALVSTLFRFVGLEGTQRLSTRQSWLQNYLLEQREDGACTWTEQAERDGW